MTKHLSAFPLLVVVFALACLPDLARARGYTLELVTIFDYLGAGVIPEGINDAGDVAGYYYDGLNIHGFIRYADGSFSDPIDYPEVNVTYVTDISNNDVISGFFHGADGIFHGFFLTNGVFTEFDVPGAASTRIEGINDAGNFTGEYTLAGTTNTSPFVAIGGIVRDIVIPLPNNGGYTQGMNNNNEVVGYYLPDRGKWHGFYQSATGKLIAPLDFPYQPSAYTDLHDVNDNGLVAGQALRFPGGDTAFLFDKGPDESRHQLLSHSFTSFRAPGAIYTSFQGINNNGLICGWFVRGEGGSHHGFIAQATPK